MNNCPTCRRAAVYPVRSASSRQSPSSAHRPRRWCAPSASPTRSPCDWCDRGRQHGPRPSTSTALSPYWVSIDALTFLSHGLWPSLNSSECPAPVEAVQQCWSRATTSTRIYRHTVAAPAPNALEIASVQPAASDEHGARLSCGLVVLCLSESELAFNLHGPGRHGSCISGCAGVCVWSVCLRSTAYALLASGGGGHSFHSSQQPHAGQTTPVPHRRITQIDLPSSAQTRRRGVCATHWS